MANRSPVICFVLALGLAGCATRPVPSSVSGEVALAPVEPPDAQRHVHAAGEKYEVGEVLPSSRRNPDYPTALLARVLPRIALCIEVSIDTHGRVDSTRTLVAAERCPAQPPDIEAPLKAAIDAALLHWEYLPSYVCRLQPGTEDDGYCADDDPSRIAIPMLQAYRFVFTQTPDGPRVETDDAAPD